MATYIEYKVNLTDSQKSKVASAMKNKSPLKHSSRKGNDEMMLPKDR